MVIRVTKNEYNVIMEALAAYVDRDYRAEDLLEKLESEE